MNLFSRVQNDENNCWNWQGCKNKEGYGHVRCMGKVMLAHRVAFLAANGWLPADKLICHHCDNPSCINPSHLFVGTNYDNTMDAMVKGRKFIPPVLQGEHHPLAKLRPRDVTEIRRLCRDQIPQSRIARQFGICQTTVSEINTGRKWGHYERAI
jgi:hypothetical protein